MVSLPLQKFVVISSGVGLVAGTTTLVLKWNSLFGHKYSSPIKFFKATGAEGQEENCVGAKLGSTARKKNLKLWVCSFFDSPETPVFYFFDNGGEQERQSAPLKPPFLAKKVSSIKLEKNKTSGARWFGNYDLWVYYSEDKKDYSHARLDIKDGEGTKPKRKQQHQNTEEQQSSWGFFNQLVKNQITELVPDKCKLEFTINKKEQKQFNSIICDQHTLFIRDGGNLSPIK